MASKTPAGAVNLKLLENSKEAVSQLFFRVVSISMK